MDRDDYLYAAGVLLISAGAGLWHVGAGLACAGGGLVLPVVLSMFMRMKGPPK